MTAALYGSCSSVVAIDPSLVVAFEEAPSRVLFSRAGAAAPEVPERRGSHARPRRSPILRGRSY
jgi:hypothetical protein